MTQNLDRPLRVFLCHSSDDKKKVRMLYNRLTRDGIDAWLDKEKILPGQRWEAEIPKAVKEADVVVICLSKNSISKAGYVQKEISFALDISDEKPENTIYLIPAKLENCTVPNRLSKWQWVDLFEKNGYEKLLSSLKFRADIIGANVKNLGKMKLELSVASDVLDKDELKLVFPPPPNWKKYDIFSDEGTWPRYSDWVDGNKINKLELNSGKFLWKAESRSGWGHWTYLGTVINPPQNFYLSIKCQKEVGLKSSEYGLLFGFADNDNFFDFQISDDGRYFIWRKLNGNYILLHEGKSNLIKPLSLNQLDVVSINQNFYYLINQQFVKKIVDIIPSVGKFGPSIRWHETGEIIAVEYSELTFMKP
jgi:hypothetical protein